MRKLVLFVGVVASLTTLGASPRAGMVPSWENSSRSLGFFPLSNEVSFYKNVDDAGEDRGATLQFVLINGFRVFTDFRFEFTADYNFEYTPGMDSDHYVELSLVKPVNGFFVLNYQRVLSTFDPKPVNQFGLRLVF